MNTPFRRSRRCCIVLAEFLAEEWSMPVERNDLDFEVAKLGECRVPSPMSGVCFIETDEEVLYHSNLEAIRSYLDAGMKPPGFEVAGPRRTIYFDPSKLKAGIVTCGGLCPGLNDAIRAIVLSLFHHYGVRTVFGFAMVTRDFHPGMATLLWS